MLNHLLWHQGARSLVHLLFATSSVPWLTVGIKKRKRKKTSSSILRCFPRTWPNWTRSVRSSGPNGVTAPLPPQQPQDQQQQQEPLVSFSFPPATATASAWRIIQLLFIPTCFPYASIRIFLAIEKKERKKNK